MIADYLEAVRRDSGIPRHDKNLICLDYGRATVIPYVREPKNQEAYKLKIYREALEKTVDPDAMGDIRVLIRAVEFRQQVRIAESIFKTPVYSEEMPGYITDGPPLGGIYRLNRLIKILKAVTARHPDCYLHYYGDRVRILSHRTLSFVVTLYSVNNIIGD